jgi:hypothetical protein
MSKSMKSSTGSAVINGQIVDGALIGGVFHYEANGAFVSIPRPRSFSSNDQYSDKHDSPRFGA